MAEDQKAHGCDIIGIDPSVLQSTQSYQFEKYVKHTSPTGFDAANTVFIGSTWHEYQNYLTSAVASGCLEMDDRGRKNLIFYAGSTTGMEFDGNRFSSTCSGIKAVQTESSTRCHGYPVNFQPESRQCAGCGRLVPFDPS